MTTQNALTLYFSKIDWKSSYICVVTAHLVRENFNYLVKVRCDDKLLNIDTLETTRILDNTITRAWYTCNIHGTSRKSWCSNYKSSSNTEIFRNRWSMRVHWLLVDIEICPAAIKLSLSLVTPASTIMKCKKRCCYMWPQS